MTSKSLMPPNCRCMKNKWIFKIKHNAVYQVHLVAYGYSQLHSIDFLENYSLVVHNVTFHVLLLMVLHFGYSTKIVNLEMDFLYRALEQEIYMECLHGMSNIKKDNFIILNKFIYGLVQSA